MKAYTTIKAISKGIMYFSAVAVLATLGLFAFDRVKTSADETSPVLSNARVQIITQNTTSSKNSNLKQIRFIISGSATGLDHFTLFVSEPNQPEISLYGDNAGLCAAVSNPNIYRIARESCPGGVCNKEVVWDPSMGGSRQVIVMFMKSSVSTACTASNIIGARGAVHDINYVQPFQSGANIIIDHSSLEATINQDYSIRASVQAGSEPISKLALFVQKTNTNFDLSAANVCHARDAENCILCLQAVKTCGSDGQPGGICTQDLTWKPSEAGIHRVVAVALGADLNTAACPGDIRGIAYYGVNASATPPPADGDGGGEGEGGNGEQSDFQMPALAKNFTNIIDTASLFGKFKWIALVILPLIAFSSVLVGGYMYITAGDDDAKVKRAKNAIVYGITAVILVFLAEAIVVAAIGIIARLGLIKGY